MMLKCVAIDDEPLALQLIKAYIQKVPTLQLLAVFEDALSAMEFMRHHPVQLLFLDVQMPDMNGLDVVRSLDVKPMIIFTTAYKKFAVEGFELDAIDYLLKPFNFERFKKAVLKAEEYHKYKSSLRTEEDYLYVYSEYKLVRVILDNIEYIESLEDYIRIHLTDGKPVLTLMPLKKILLKLPPEKFQRVHRGYVVAVNKIRLFTNKKIVLKNAELPVSDTYIAAIRKLKNS